MRSATAGFQKSSHAYERGRPGYPPGTVSYIVETGRLAAGRTVVDLAAGTGKLTRELVVSGARVVAVEPLGEMRGRLVEQLPDVEVSEGTAEATGLADDFADALTVAQAFHWFASETALKEMHRLLRPDGLLFLVWNRRDLSDPIQAAISKLTVPFVKEAPSYGSGEWQETMAATAYFVAAGEHHCSFSQRVDRERIVDRVASTSYIANLDEAVRTPLLAKVAALVEEGESLQLAYSSDVYSYRASS